LAEGFLGAGASSSESSEERGGSQVERNLKVSDLTTLISVSSLEIFPDQDSNSPFFLAEVGFFGAGASSSESSAGVKVV